ncbi:MAG: cation:proton antiporter [Planctomycetota bacterium]|nr:cation:proton antiporter [Planctomycetota bacterium]
MWMLASDPTAGEAQLVLDLLVILATAGLVAAVLQRLRMAVAPAYLIAGAFIGPNALGFVRSGENIEAISSLAIILLLFGIGLHMHLPALKGSFRALITAGVGAVVLTIAALWPLSMLFGLSAPTGLAVSMALSLSSTAVVLRILGQQREMSTPYGRLAFAILVIQDLLVLGMLAAFPLLSGWAGLNAEDAEPVSPLQVTADALLRIGGVSLLIIAGRLILPRLLTEAARSRSSEVMMVLSIATAIGAAVATKALGFSPELGAFLAGFLLSGTPFKHQIAGQVGPLRDLFIAVFFTTVGMLLVPATLLEFWWVILLATLALMLVKSIAIGATCWAVGATGSASLAAGMALSQAGEFSLVLVDVAADNGLVGPDVAGKVVAVVVLSLVATPSTLTMGKRLAGRLRDAPLAPWVKSSKLRESEPDAPDGAIPKEERRQIRKVIVAGFGPVGRAVVDKLREAGVSVTIIELNPATVKTQAKLGREIVFGDVSNAEVLESAHVQDADAVILTIPDDAAVLAACKTIRTLAPDVFIAARTDFLSRGMLATGFGADLVTVDEIATAEVMQREVLKKLSERERGWTEERRSRDRAADGSNAGG